MSVIRCLRKDWFADTLTKLLLRRSASQLLMLLNQKPKRSKLPMVLLQKRKKMTREMNQRATKMKRIFLKKMRQKETKTFLQSSLSPWRVVNQKPRQLRLMTATTKNKSFQVHWTWHSTRNELFKKSSKIDKNEKILGSDDNFSFLDSNYKLISDHSTACARLVAVCFVVAATQKVY